MRHPRGVTTIELLVVLTLIGVLLAVLIPAIQSSRTSARRVTCTNRMRQIGIAMASFEATHRHIPAARHHNGLSWSAFLLPWLDLTSVSQQLDFSIAERTSEEYNAMSLLPIPQFLCPESPFGRGTSFVGNIGTSYLDAPADLSFHRRIENGYFAEGVSISADKTRRVTLADFSDGLSTTAAVSEIQHQTPPRPLMAAAGTGRTGFAFRLKTAATVAGDYPEFVNDCDTMEGSQRVIVFMGAAWHDGEVFQSVYTHHLSPNRNSCVFTRRTGEMIRGFSIATAGSLHAGGVNVLLADGGTRFVSEQIDRSAWQSLGTRSGKEILAESF